MKELKITELSSLYDYILCLGKDILIGFLTCKQYGSCRRGRKRQFLLEKLTFLWDIFCLACGFKITMYSYTTLNEIINIFVSKVTDENDNIPTFVEHTFSFEVYESAAKVL